MVERVDDDILISDRRDKNRRATGTYHLLIIFVSQCGVTVTIISSNANHRLAIGFREGGIDFTQMRV